MFNYSEMKLALYGLETVLGVLLVIAALVFFGQSQSAQEPITYLFPAVVLMCVGFICVLFGIETYLMREDPDIWR